MSYTSRDCRRAMVRAALKRAEKIQRDYDPGQEATPKRIEQMVRDAGAAWALGDDGKYTHEEELEQCGMLISASAREVGDYLDDSSCVDVRIKDGIAPECLISTARLYYQERWDDAGVLPPERVPPQATQMGDIVVTGKSKQIGDHITLATSNVDQFGQISTVEANAVVDLADGTRGEGLGTNVRHVSEVAHVYRLVDRHWAGSAFLPGGGDE